MHFGVSEFLEDALSEFSESTTSNKTWGFTFNNDVSLVLDPP